MRGSSLLFAVGLLMPSATPVSAQVLGAASSAAHGSSGQGPSGGSGGRGSSSGGGGGSSGGSSGGSAGREDPRAQWKCPKDQAPLDCVRERWIEAGLGDVGGAFFFWATVLGEYPYANDSGGYAVPALDEDGEERGERTALRLELESGYVLAGAGRMALGARLQLPFFVDLASRYSLFFEPEGGELVAALLGRVDLEVRVLDANGLQLRVGAGMRHFHDRLGSELGAGIGLGVDVFPGEPVVLSASADVGAVGSALLVALRASLGVMLDATELYVGYHYEALFGVVDADLGGVMLGMRQWL